MSSHSTSAACARIVGSARAEAHPAPVSGWSAPTLGAGRVALLAGDPPAAGPSRRCPVERAAAAPDRCPGGGRRRPGTRGPGRARTDYLPRAKGALFQHLSYRPVAGHRRPGVPPRARLCAPRTHATAARVTRVRLPAPTGAGSRCDGARLRRLGCLPLLSSQGDRRVPVGVSSGPGAPWWRGLRVGDCTGGRTRTCAGTRFWRPALWTS